MLNRYVELKAGAETLWRGTSYSRALSVRCNSSLRVHKGHKVSVADVVSSRRKPLGFMQSGRA